MKENKWILEESLPVVLLGFRCTLLIIIVI